MIQPQAELRTYKGIKFRIAQEYCERQAWSLGAIILAPFSGHPHFFGRDRALALPTRRLTDSHGARPSQWNDGC